MSNKGLREDGSFNIVPPEDRIPLDEARAMRDAIRVQREGAADAKREKRNDIRSAPVRPADPVRPSAPVRPADPVRPSAPVRPADPIRPSAPVRPADPVRVADPAAQKPESGPAYVKREEVQGIIQQAVRAVMGRGVTDDAVRRIVREMVPYFVTNMDRSAPGGPIEKVRVGFDGNTLLFRSDLSTGGGDTLIRFVGTLNGGSLDVSAGRWSRNGIVVEFSGYMVSVVDGDYVWLELVSSTADSALRPDSITLSAGATVPADDETEGVILVLGKVVDGVWEQWWHGGDIDDWVVVPDGNENMGSPGIRRTVVFNPEDTVHAGELQLYNAETIGNDVYAVPFFDSDSSGPPVAGELDWANIDSHNPKSSPTQCSIEVASGVLQLFDVDTALDQTVPVVDAFTSVHALKYAYPVTDNASPNLTGAGTGPAGGSKTNSVLSGYPTAPALTNTGSSLEFSFSTRELRIADGRMDLMEEIAETPLSIDLATVLSGLYADSSHAHDIDDITNMGTFPEWFTHANLEDMPSATNTDHDGRYWANLAELGAADTADYSTTGDVEVGVLRVGTTNSWDDAEFSVEVTGAATMEAASLALTLSGDFSIDTYVGITGDFTVYDGSYYILRFYKGILWA